MEITVTPKDNHSIIAIEGAIDGKTAPEAQSVLAPVLERNATVVLDLTKVHYLSSAGLRVLLLTHRQLAAKNGRAILVGLNDNLLETMRITGFLQFFTTYATLDQVQL